MAKFQFKKKSGIPEISTASLPDIVFMLLFFFMVSTAMREVDLKIKVSLPEATEVKILENKSLISYIYVGVPLKRYQVILGMEPRIQINDRFVNLDEISGYVDAQREPLTEYEARRMTISLKSDKGVKMGIITDLKEELKKADALKINYAAMKDIK